MDYAPTLGLFGLLPRELRDQIWGHLSTNRHLKIFQTSRQIYTEASRSFYSNHVISFHIEPKYHRKSWLTIKSNLGAEWSLQSLDHAIEQGFNTLPYEKLKSIEININAPDTTDPGQLVCLFLKCRDLAALLEHAKQGLPDLVIKFLDSVSAKWPERDNQQQSISIDPKRHYPPLRRNPDLSPEARDRFYDYYERIDWTLDPDSEETPNEFQDSNFITRTFLRLRNVRSARIIVPLQCGGFWSPDDSGVLQRKEPMGFNQDPEGLWSDASIQEDMDDMYLQIDLDLDLLPGPTANMMRLHRFSSWYRDQFRGESRYEKEYERIILTRGGVEFDYRTRRIWSLFRRYAGMRALNPMALEHQYTQFQLWAQLMTHPSLFESAKHASKIISKAIDLQIIMDGWDQDAWHHQWPEGIPPFDSMEYSARFSQTSGSDASKKYEKDFERKLHQWSVEADKRHGEPSKIEVNPTISPLTSPRTRTHNTADGPRAKRSPEPFAAGPQKSGPSRKISKNPIHLRRLRHLLADITHLFAGYRAKKRGKDRHFSILGPK
ncbi:MAG: hypothetical protein Q9182_006484 [Xanthomendoza sp. 2 TL-2023]